ncbi:MAG: HpcH/HpaI aldolase family protein [Gammaproteobacteria bacterium]
MPSFAERLAAHEKLLGTIVALNSPAVAELVSQFSFDWIFIDAEHGALPIDGIENLVRACKKPALVRIADHSEKAVKQALEVGAQGVIVPQVNSAETAAAIVSYAKYPPLGRRGVGVGRANGYGMAFADYLQSANDETVVVAQIEHIDAVENVNEIISTENLSAVLIGPNDLAASMNLLGQTEHHEVLAAIDKVRTACVNQGMPLGIFHGDPVKAIEYGQNDFSLIACGVDSIVLGNAAQALATQLSAALKNYSPEFYYWRNRYVTTGSCSNLSN